MMNRRKIIIEIKGDVTDYGAATAVTEVLRGGKISKERDEPVYAHVTTFPNYMYDTIVERRPYTRNGLVKFVVYHQGEEAT